MLMEWTLSLNKNLYESGPKLWSRISLSLSSTKPSVTFTLTKFGPVPEPFFAKRPVHDGRLCAAPVPPCSEKFGCRRLWPVKETPTAVQGRIGAAKGVWFVDPLSDPRSEKKWVEIRPSQLKFRYDPITFQDTTLRTLVSLLK